MTASSMSYRHGFRTTRVASEAITAKACVKATANNGMGVADAGDNVVGVSPPAVANGQTGVIQYSGTAVCVASGAIAVNGRVTSDANGKVKAASDTLAVSSSAVTPEPDVGIALNATSNDGDFVEVLLAY